MTWNPAGSLAARGSAAALVTAAVICLSGAALAANEIGLFFDGQAQRPCEQAGAFATLSTYLILLDPSCRGGVCGWECAVKYENASFLGASLSGETLNLATPPEFHVGMGAPLSTSPAVVLAQLSFLTSGGGPVRFYIERYSRSLVDTPQYADCADIDNLVAMTPRTISANGAVAGVNSPECTPQSATWGQVKAVFQ